MVIPWIFIGIYGLLGIIVILVLSLLYLKYKYCKKEDDEERRPVLFDKNMNRTSTYYSWNKIPVQNSQPENNNSRPWENKRNEILKKYARDNSSV